MPKVSDLAEALTIADGDFLAAVVGGNSRKVKKSTLLATTPVSGVKLQAAVVAAGQTSLPWTSVPSWINRITVNLAELSTNGTSRILVQVGDSGGYLTSGYVGSETGFGGTSTNTAAVADGWGWTPAAASDAASGAVVLTRVTGNTWAAMGVVRRAATSSVFVAGSVVLTGALDRVRLIMANGTDTFDTGSASASWE